jgi:hypothetical protein
MVAQWDDDRAIIAPTIGGRIRLPGDPRIFHAEVLDQRGAGLIGILRFS